MENRPCLGEADLGGEGYEARLLLLETSAAVDAYGFLDGGEIWGGVLESLRAEPGGESGFETALSRAKVVPGPVSSDG